MHLLSASLFVLPVKHPVVPSGESRLRVTLHAGNTTAQVISLVDQIYVWVEEIMAIEDGSSGAKVTKAAKEVYAWMKEERLGGFGMV
jgi:8-amino-7-oxononanoate synthase